MKRILTSLAIFAAAALAPLAIPQTAEAQCTLKCTCYSDGCGCSNQNGNGSQCDASGNGCFVKACGSHADPEVDQSPVGFAADGSVLLASTDRAGATTFSAAPAPPAGSEWQETRADVFVARNCAGVIVARRYGAVAAAEVRRRDAVLEI